MSLSTEMQLLALFRQPTVRLEDISDHYLHLSPPVARQRAALNQLPFPTFRLTDSQKAPVMVKISDLAAHIDAKRDTAQAEWEHSQV
jgi:hypothetical protein